MSRPSASRSKSVGLLARAGRPTLSTIPEGKQPSRRPSMSVPMPGAVNSAVINAQRSSKTSTKLVVLPSEPQTRPLPGELEDEESTTLITKKAELYLWDRDDGHFLKQADIYGSIAQPVAGYTFLITAMTSDGQQLLAHKLSSGLNARWSTKLASLTWNNTSAEGTISSWCFKFENSEDFKEFQEVYGSCMYEVLNQVSWEKAKV